MHHIEKMMRHYKWFIHYKINIVKVWSLIDRTINHEFLLIHLFKKKIKKSETLMST
jgi:hypothetical protein